MTDTTKPNPFLEPLITLVVPALILMKLSDPEQLGAIPALLLALAFPLVWGMRDTPGKLSNSLPGGLAA